ncbi:MAG TPA: hypothetical protein VH186_14090 [Chloroflexia bacterium]|nr:hypothetical protein [Chloroflexia bacterium]
MRPRSFGCGLTPTRGVTCERGLPFTHHDRAARSNARTCPQGGHKAKEPGYFNASG